MDRKLWLRSRLKRLTEIFAISVGSYSLMDNHLHVIVRLDLEIAASWSDYEVALRWAKLYPPRAIGSTKLDLDDWVKERIADMEWISQARERLQSLSWFMKSLKEPFSRLVNKEENCKGTLFEARFKSIAILDQRALLFTSAYVDMNPIRANMATSLQTSYFTSIQERIEHALTCKRTTGDETCPTNSLGLKDDSLWLLPIEFQSSPDVTRKGMLDGINFEAYLMMLDGSLEHSRNELQSVTVGKQQNIFEQLGIDQIAWTNSLRRFSESVPSGRFSANGRPSADLTHTFGVSRIVNVMSGVRLNT